MLPATDMIADLNVRLNGRTLPAAALTDISSVSVEENTKSAASFSLTLYNWDEKKLVYTWSDHRLFSLGARVQISLGYLGNLNPVITGEITTIAPTFSAGVLPTVVIRGYDLSHRLRGERHTRTYKNVKVSDIAQQIATRAGLKARITNSKTKHKYIMQKKQSDMDFLQKQAKEIGFEVYVRHNELVFKPQIPPQKARHSLSLDRDVINFSPKLTLQGQVDKVIVRSWDIKQKKAIKGVAGVGDEKKMGGSASGPQELKRALKRSRSLTINLPQATQAEVDQIAKGQLQDAALDFITGGGSCYGRSWLHSGMLVNIKGAGRRFSGVYKVIATTHTLNGSEGYRTSFEVERNTSS